MNNQINYIWASDYSKNTGEGILGRLFIKKIIIQNKRIKNKKFILLKGSKNKDTFFHKYINPFKGVFYLRKNKKNNIIYLNYLSLWNFIIFILLPKKTILGPITGGEFRRKVEDANGFIRKYIFPIMYKISLSIIQKKFTNVIFSTSILKKYVTKKNLRNCKFNFILQNFNTKNTKVKFKKKFDIIIYNRNHATKKNSDLNQMVEKIYHSNLKTIIFGDKLNFKPNKRFIYKGFVDRNVIIKYLKKSHYVINNQENYYSLFAIDAYNSQCLILSDKNIYKEKNISKNFINMSFKNFNYKLLKNKKFIIKDKYFFQYVNSNNNKTNTLLG